EAWNTRIELVRHGGMHAVSDGVICRWFSPAFRAKSPEKVSAAKTMLDSTNPQGYLGNCAAVRDFDARESLSAVIVPTLAIAGALDPVTTTADGKFIAERIKGSQFAELQSAHLSNLEAPDEFNAEIGTFLGA